VVNYEVHRFSRDPSTPGRATVDSGADIDRGSLTLSADRQTMRWTKGGEMHSAPLPLIVYAAAAPLLGRIS
jgi:hypothetical protein